MCLIIGFITQPALIGNYTCANLSPPMGSEQGEVQCPVQSYDSTVQLHNQYFLILRMDKNSIDIENRKIPGQKVEKKRKGKMHLEDGELTRKFMK